MICTHSPSATAGGKAPHPKLFCFPNIKFHTQDFVFGIDEEKIEINFDIYSGDASLTFVLDEENITPKKIKYGNSQKYIFEGKGIERIQIIVKAVVSSYYVLSYIIRER